MNEKGFFDYAIVFVIIIISLFSLFVFLAPILQQFVASSYVAMEPQLDRLEDRVNQMDDNSLKASALSTIQAQKDNVGLNIEIFGGMFTYAAILIGIIVLIVIFIGVRTNVQVGGGIA